MLRKTKVEFLAVPILGVEVTAVFHGLSCQNKLLPFRTNLAILQRHKYTITCENLVPIHHCWGEADMVQLGSWPSSFSPGFPS
jgi:hypothetical protein